MGESNNTLKEEILLALSISLGALFFATALTLIIARFYKKIRACCESCCPSEQDSNANTFFVYRSNPKPVVPYQKLVERRKEAATQLPHQNPPAFLQSNENKFTIPGEFYASSIQPELKRTPATENYIDSRHSSTSSRNSPYRNRRLTESVVSLPANFSPKTARNLLKPKLDPLIDDDASSVNSEGKNSFSMEDLASFDLQPELYNISRQRTLGIGSLGKVQVSLQYEDKSRKKLNITLKKLTKLQIIRPDIVGIYASVVLLPEREAIYTTKQQKVSSIAAFDEKFVFSSRPMNRDFEAKTALFLIHYVDKSSKDIVYGEARLPLLCKEIYSQVLTDVALNIKIASMQSEFGDVLIQLIYNDPGSLHVLVKTVKVPSNMPLENMSALQVKCYLKRLGNRVGKKTTLSKSLEGPTQHNVDINGECKFKISHEDFKDSDLTCAISGKYKIMGKKTQLGKAVMGGSSKDDTGVKHWNIIFNSPGIAWTVWHPIYNV